MPGLVGLQGGSSPLTRGKPTTPEAGRQWPRLIPAHAGKTGRALRRRRCPQAHPRSRGENGQPPTAARPIYGSSPLTRGKRSHLAGAGCSPPAHPRSRGENAPILTQLVSALRLIPAHAGKTRSMTRQGTSSPAHPRSRGENHFEYAAPETVKGSSPLTRGKHQPADLGCERPRLIPAHAGKTDACRANLRGPWAHPRSRGENAGVGAALMLAPGSSPLTRGKHAGSLDRLAGERLIPAHAGKTPSCGSTCGRMGAHPRSRGENDLPRERFVRVDGSSPLTRGKRRTYQPADLRHRLIPAHAGKTDGGQVVGLHIRAHPRSRGENINAVAGGNAETGSSPLTRGKPARRWTGRTSGRLIPAHAGKTISDGVRWSGEYGSSPLTRGKRDVPCGEVEALGLIPAHAGKTPVRQSRLRRRGAHPRSRGENSCA